MTILGTERVTHQESRLREAQFWAGRSIAERVQAGWELAENDLHLQESDEPEKRTAWTLRRVPNRRY